MSAVLIINANSSSWLINWFVHHTAVWKLVLAYSLLCVCVCVYVARLLACLLPSSSQLRILLFELCFSSKTQTCALWCWSTAWPNLSPTSQLKRILMSWHLAPDKPSVQAQVSKKPFSPPVCSRLVGYMTLPWYTGVTLCKKMEIQASVARDRLIQIRNLESLELDSDNYF